MNFMAKLWGLLGLFILTWPSFAQVQLEQTREGVLSFEWESAGPEVRPSSAPEIQGAPLFSELAFEELPLSQTPEHPSLPYQSFIVEAEAKNLKVSVKNQQVEVLPGVTPAPAALWPCRCEGQTPQWHFQKAAYQKPKIQSWVQVTSLGDYKGRPLSRVTFYPAKLKDVQSVEYLTSATVEIHGARPWSFERAERSSFSSQRLLIIAPPKFKKAMQVFAKAKSQAGFDIVWIDYKDQTPDQLRKEVHALYAEQKLDFAVIAGSHSEVPGHLVETSADPQTPTDRLYFSIGGEDDYVPDVFYSRLVAKDAAALGRLVDKILSADTGERRPLQNEAMGLASDEGFKPTDEQYVQQMISPLEKSLGWRAEYYFQRKRGHGPEAILEGFARGAHWLNYIGHGVGPAWTSISGREFNLDDIKQIPSHEALPVVVDVACQNGHLKHDGRIGVHLMNHFDRGAAAGAKAYYGGNVDISWHPPAVMAVGIGQARASRQYQHLAEVLWAGQIHLLETYEDLPAALENLTWYHLQGDPSLRLPQ